jgi:hypothetical protein
VVLDETANKALNTSNRQKMEVAPLTNFASINILYIHTVRAAYNQSLKAASVAGFSMRKQAEAYAHTQMPPSV